MKVVVGVLDKGDKKLVSTQEVNEKNKLTGKQKEEEAIVIANGKIYAKVIDGTLQLVLETEEEKKNPADDEN
jgi:hypothetical protein